MPALQDKLIQFVANQAGSAADDFDENTVLFSSSLLDSYTMIDLIEFIEKNENVRFKPADIRLENLDSIDKIVTFVRTRKEGQTT